MLRVDPDVTRNLFARSLRERLDVLLFAGFLFHRRIRESGLEHARGTDVSIA